MAGGGAGWINKEAMKRTPPQVIGWQIWAIAVWVSFTGGLHGFNTSNISGIMSMATFTTDFHLKGHTTAYVSDYKGWVTASMLLGQTFAALISGSVSDRYGRKASILCASVFFIIGTLVMYFSNGSYAIILAGRVINGLGSGFGSTVGTVYLAEVAPKAVRGCVGVLYNCNIMTGVTLAYWINYGVFHHIPVTSSNQWRVPIILQMIPGLILLIGLPFVPETPRYLLYQGQSEKALKSMEVLTHLPRDHPYIQEEYAMIQAAVELDKDVPRGFRGQAHTVAHIFRDRSLRKRMILILVMQFLFIFSGGNSITYYINNILSSVGLSTDSQLLFPGVYGLVKVGSVLFYAFVLVDRFGRRPLLLIGSTVNAIALLYLTIYLAKNTGTGSPGAAAWMAVVFICIFAVGYGFGWAPVPFLTTSEIFGTRTRSIAVSLAITWQNLINFAITKGFPSMTVSMGSWGPFALYFGTTVLGTIYMYFAFPECKGRPLELMESLFDHPWYELGPLSTKASALAEITKHNEAAAASYDLNEKIEPPVHLEHVDDSSSSKS